jgi:transcription elongation factor GreA
MVRRQEYITAEGEQTFEDELSHLRNVRRMEIASQISKSHEAGGVADNADYEEAKNEQSFVEGRISEIEYILDRVVVADKSMLEKGVGGFGSSVNVKDQTNRRQRYEIVGSAEVASLESTISIESPVGKTLVGHKVGDVVEVKTPSGVNKLTITRIR